MPLVGPGSALTCAHCAQFIFAPRTLRVVDSSFEGSEGSYGSKDSESSDGYIMALRALRLIAQVKTVGVVNATVTKSPRRCVSQLDCPTHIAVDSNDDWFVLGYLGQVK